MSRISRSERWFHISQRLLFGRVVQEMRERERDFDSFVEKESYRASFVQLSIDHVLSSKTV